MASDLREALARLIEPGAREDEDDAEWFYALELADEIIAALPTLPGLADVLVTDAAVRRAAGTVGEPRDDPAVHRAERIARAALIAALTGADR